MWLCLRQTTAIPKAVMDSSMVAYGGIIGCDATLMSSTVPDASNGAHRIGIPSREVSHGFTDLIV